jgi:hypothetical protein
MLVPSLSLTMLPGMKSGSFQFVQFERYTMITLTTDYKRESITETFPTIDDATTAYADADWAACHQPGNDIRRITLRIDGATVKTKTY